jgi:predicted nucleic acid-binding protein
MAQKWILNASPLILLHKIDFLQKMSPLSPTWLIPEMVIQEVEEKDSIDNYISPLSSNAHVEVLKTLPIEPSIASWDLGPGESEVLTHALDMKNAGVILDDLLARKCAMVHNLLLKGTIGVVVWAKSEGIIDRLKPYFNGLLAAGIRIEHDLINDLLNAFNEL